MNKFGVCFTLMLLCFLTACLPGGMAISPESAVTQELIEYNAAIPDSIRIHQSVPWQENIVVLASYTSTEGSEAASCEAVFEMEHIATGWHASGSGIGCSIPPNTDAVTFGSGSQGVAPDDFSYAHGLVKLPSAETVEITWPDGTTQHLQVVNHSFLALRDGTFHMIARLDILDSNETVIHEIEIMPDVQKLP